MAQVIVSGETVRPVGPFAKLAAVFQSLRVRQRRAAAMREITRMDPRLLYDLGIDSGDVPVIASELAIRQMEQAQVSAVTPSLSPSRPFALGPTERGTALA